MPIQMIINKKTKYKSFTKKKDALVYQSKNPHLCLYALDLSSVSASKQFIVSEDERVFVEINKGHNHFYENIERDQEVAFGLDLDIKNIEEKEDKKTLDDLITGVIQKVQLYFDNKWGICLTSKNFIITKSDYCKKKKKHSFHIKVSGYKFPCPYVIKYYFNQMGFTEEEHGVDCGVYRTGLIRMTFCSKKGQRRPLLPYYLGDVKPTYIYNVENNSDKKYEYFKKSKWTYVEDYEDIDISEYVDMLNEKEQQKLEMIERLRDEERKEVNYDNATYETGCKYDISTLRDIINVIDVKRFNNYGDWIKLLWILKRMPFDCFELFNEVSSKADKYEGVEKTLNTWNKQDATKYPYSIGTLKYWAKMDNPEKYKQHVMFYERFDKYHIKKIIERNSTKCFDENNEAFFLTENKKQILLEVMDYMNKFYMKVRNGGNGKVLFLQQIERDIILTDKKNFLDDLENLNLNFKYKKVVGDEIEIVTYPCSKYKDIHNVGRLFLSTLEQASVDKITFIPREDVFIKRTFNTYTGIDITKESCEYLDVWDVSAVSDHILNVWCKGDPVIYDYTIKLLATYVQTLDRTNVALVISGEKGTGKSCIIEKILAIYGKRYSKTVAKLDNVLGNFNSTLKECLMCYVNEATFTGNKEETNKLRNLISCPDITINEKYMPSYTLTNYCNFIIDGNGDQLVCNHGKERRFLILETDNKWKGVDTPEKRKYFKPILDTPPEHIAKWLYSIDLSDFNVRDIPDTQKIKEARVDSFDSVESFLYDIIDEGVHDIFNKHYEINIFYDEYVAYCNNGFKVSKNKFSREVNKKCDVLSKKRMRHFGKVCVFYKLNSVSSNKKKYEELFGSLKWTNYPSEIELVGDGDPLVNQ